MDEKALEELLEGKTRIPRRANIPSISHYRHEAYNPLLRFNLAQAKLRQVEDILKKLAIEAKIKIYKEPIPEESQTLEHHPDYPMRCLRLEAQTVHPPALLKSWEQKIIGMLPEKIKLRFPLTMEDVVKEVKSEYDRCLLNLSVRRKFKPLKGEYFPVYEEKPYMHGRTERYHLFLKRRKKLEVMFYLTHPIMGKILNTAYLFLPHLILDLSKYRSQGLMDLTQLKTAILQDIKKVDNIIIQKWYPKIAALMSAKNALDKVPKDHWVKFVDCASNLVTVKITELKRRTFEHVLKVSTDPTQVPFIKMDLVYDDNVVLYPEPQEYYNFYQFVIASIHSVASNLISLESWVDVPCKRFLIPTDIRDGSLDQCNQEIEDNAKQLYKPVLDYVNNLIQDYDALYSTQLLYDVDEFINEPHSFEDTLGIIDYLYGYRTDLQNMVVNVYFPVGRLCLTDVLKNLRGFLDEFITKLGGDLCSIHKNWNKKICQVFEEVTRRAFEVPKATEELVEMGDYMLWAKSELLLKLRELILESIRNMAILSEITSLSQEHLDLNGVTMMWLHNIKPVFEHNSSLYEQYKFQFEEALLARVARLKKGMEELTPKLVKLDLMEDADHVREYLMEIRKFLRKIEEFDRDLVWINKEELLFKFPITQYPDLDELKDIIHPFSKIMNIINRWQRTLKVWMDGSFEDLVYENVESATEDFYKKVVMTQKWYRAKIKQQTEDSYSKRFKGIADDTDFRNLPAPIKLCMKTATQIKEFRPNVVFVEFLCNPALTQRHWDEMSRIVGFDFTPDAGTTLRKLLNLNLTTWLDQFEIVSVGATKELQLINILAKMKAEWADINFTTGLYKDTGVTILSTLTDVQALLDDHIIKTLSMRGSVFVKPIEAEVREWYDKLLRVNSTIDEWGKVQVQWLYLLPIFSSEDIVRQMPTEGGLFQRVDNVYKRLIAAVLADPHVMDTAGTVGVLETLVECTEMLDTINDGVNDYLEKKRLYFARFFFLSNDEMLEILSETEDPLRVQPHLKKCFEGIAKLKFNEELDILAMFSGEGEEVDLVDQISTAEARGSVEKWLVQVEEQMKISVRHQIYISYIAYANVTRDDWVIQWPGQVVLCVSQIYWTADVHKCLRTSLSEVYDYSIQLLNQLNSIVVLVRGRLSKQSRITLGALVVLDVHAKDTTAELVKKKIDNDLDFEWLAQLRYYWDDSNVQVRCTNATVHYAYEYLGNTPRLVITPLTDRCYRTLIGAYHLHLNGAPEGPAGTGKTETTKDLAKALAVQCVVFNCSDGLDYIAMGKFFKGLASAGAWACFDEFNRIDLEVLSVVAQQILCIVQAVRSNLTTFVFEGTELTLNPAVYVCITMNPGYAGRSELPDNLKVLFRTVAMMVPDYALIGEISLYSFGFVNARVLAVKIVTTYRLCSEQLSSQNHYDYGMRAVKTVLAAAGNLKLKFPDEQEDVLLLRSIIDVNLPKFLSFDVPLFDGIMSDLFHGIVLPTPNYDDFLDATRVVCETLNLQPVDTFLLKVTQTYEMMIVRHGFMLVGEPFGGKTSTLKTLAGALTLMSERGLEEEKVRFRVINPKSITMGQLYGQFDPVSYEWSDGVVATTFRKYAYADTPDRKWVIFDGPVDAVWIENLNTVLDDNKKLCLTSGEILQLSPQMSMIFEVMDLSQASPATVSRCGMIYMEPLTLGWYPFVKSWITISNPVWIAGNEDLFLAIAEWVFLPSLVFVRKQGVQLVFAGVVNSIMATLALITMLLNDAVRINERHDHLRIWIQAAFIFSVVWGIAGLLNVSSRAAFDEFYKNIWNGLDEDNPIPPLLETVDIPIPVKGLLHEHMYTFKDKGVWVFWPEVLKVVDMDQPGSIEQIMVPTVETARYQYMMDLHIRHQVPMLIVGDTGTGKSFYFQNMLMYRLSDEDYIPAFITFTAQTSANQTQELIVSKLNKRRKGMYGPPKGKKCVIFVDNINMPAKEIYGAQPPIELLRQYFDHGHWYDLKDTSKLFLFDILLVAAMGPPGGSRQEIYQRFLRHFNIYSINPFSDESMNKIYSTVLMIGLKRNNFSTDVMSIVYSIVAATVEIYQSAIHDLRPTPAKSHYIFNLRDFSRVIQGCSLIKKESVDSKKVFIKLWVHEALRVFYDRLIDKEDKAWFYSKLRYAVEEHFNENFDRSLDTLPLVNGKVTEGSLKDLFFGNYMDPEATEEEKKYEEIPSIEAFNNIALLSLEEYNSTHKAKMDIVLFRYALEHLSRICRVLVTPCGSSLLVGMGGSGRQSLTRLASEITSSIFFQPEITKTYSMNDWRDDLKRVLKQSGGMNKDTTFLFTESQIKEEDFLQDIDSLLNSGEVPNIYAVDERQEILELVRLAAQGGNRNLDVSALAVYSFFITRCRRKLHMLLCFSPIGSSFRSRLRLFPALVNCCTIDWYEMWPEDALEMVAHKYMTDVNVPDAVKICCINSCKYFHVTSRAMSDKFYVESGRKTYITSAAYLELIRSFTKLTNAKQEEIMEAKMRYVGGLEKLLFAAEQVSALQKELSALRPQLVVAAKMTVDMLTMIERETKQVEKASAMVKEDEVVANAQAASAQALKNECEADLALAMPVLEEALSALNTLKPSDITLVKSMKNPPAAIKLVMAAVCVMKDVKPDKVKDPSTGKSTMEYWGPSKKLLGDMAFLQLLKDYDKDNIAPHIMKKIRAEFIPHPDFKPHIVAKASSAAEGLCKWIIAMDMYDLVAKEVAPKKEKLEGAERELNETMALLEAKRDQVRTLEERIMNLNTQLAETTERKINLENEVELLRNKLIRAEKLIGGLGGEKDRWSNAAEGLQKDYDSLAGDILISCGFIAYLSPLSIAYRNESIEDWRKYVINLKIPCSDEFTFRRVLGSELKIQDWNIAGLPRDAFSVDNAIIVDKSNRWSLLVDPQGQANKWIKNMERAAELQIFKFSNSNYMKILETCVQLGRPALLENIGEELEAPLEPLLTKQIFKQGSTYMIGLGDNVVEYSLDFRFYITSKLRNPHFLPEVFNKVTLVNFALTIEGLEDQLLGIVVAKERPDLEMERQNLIIQNAENVSGLKRVEDSILITLSQASGNILEDESAIEVLDSSKILSQAIFQKQEESKVTQAEIDNFRENYQPIARHSSVLYYCVTDIANIDPMYQYSLDWFINLYISSIDKCQSSKNIDERLAALYDAFTFNLYNNVSRSLFEKDKLLFSFILCTSIMMSQDKLNKESLMFFLTGGVGLENTLENPAQDWLSDKSWDEICRLNDLPGFDGFLDSFQNHISEWKQYYDLTEPQVAEIPMPWQDSLSRFQKLIVIRVFRPDKVLATIVLFVSDEMGRKYVLPPNFDIESSYADSDCLCPLIFILSAGGDPMAALLKFAQRMGFESKFQFISLGQGQGPIAEVMIKKARVDGDWVCLQNCHLAVSWMPTMERTWENFDRTNTSPRFRLWLTSYPSPHFPVAILQFGVKMTNEPPTGLKQNLLRSYLSEPVKEPDFYNACSKKEKEFTRLLFGLCFFHAVIQERKKFGAIGWNIPYGFNESDFHISIMQLQMFINESEKVPYPAIAYLAGECNYGGRVTDDWDRRTLTTILAGFINPNVVDDPDYLFSPAGKEYGIPEKTKYLDCIRHIEGLPAIPPPEVFGLHMNAGIIRDLQESQLFIDTMLIVHGEVSEGESGRMEQILSEIVGDILAKLPPHFDLEAANQKYPTRYDESMNTVLVQEMERFNRLHLVIRTTLQSLKMAVKGLVVMSPALETMAGSLMILKVPASWDKVSYPSLKPLGNYVADFEERINFLQTWYEEGKPQTYWLSGFFFTQAFLTGAIQNYARKHVIAINLLTYDFDILHVDTVEKGAVDGVYVYGIYVDGARWDRNLGVLAEQFPKILRDPMPLIWIKPILMLELQEGSRYKCPLYKTSERRGILSTTGHSTNYVLPFLLGTNVPPAHWIKRGVALLCQLDN